MMIFNLSHSVFCFALYFQESEPPKSHQRVKELEEELQTERDARAELEDKYQ